MYSALDIAKAILVGQSESGNSVNLAALQNLTFLAQAYHMVFLGGRPLFEEPVYAGPQGAEIFSIQVAYAPYHADLNLVVVPPIEQNSPLKAEALGIVSLVLSKYGQFGSQALTYAVQQIRPWLACYVPGETQLMPNAQIEQYYQKFAVKNTSIF